jgi:hypothetical protein
MRPVMACARWAAHIPKDQSNRNDSSHAQTTPSAPEAPSVALATHARRLWTHRVGAGRPGSLGRPGAPRSRTAHTGPAARRCRAIDLPGQADAHVGIDHHHAATRAEYLTDPSDQHSGHRPGRRKRTCHHGPTRHDRRTGQGWPHDDHRGSVDVGRHNHRADRDRADDHQGAEHNRADQHGRAHHDTAPDDQRRAHHNPAHHHRAHYDRAGDDHDRAADPPRRPASARLGRDRRRARARLGPAVPAAGAPATTWRDPRQTAGRQAPPPPWLSRPPTRDPRMYSFPLNRRSLEAPTARSVV